MISGIMFIHKVNGEKEAVAFEDLPIERQREILDKKDISWTKEFVIKLAAILKEIETNYNLENDEKHVEDD